MNITELNFIGSLDPDGMNGSIQVLLQDHQDKSFEDALKEVSKSFSFQVVSHRNENRQLVAILQRYGLYESEIIGLK